MASAEQKQAEADRRDVDEACEVASVIAEELDRSGRFVPPSHALADEAASALRTLVEHAVRTLNLEGH